MLSLKAGGLWGRGGGCSWLLPVHRLSWSWKTNTWSGKASWSIFGMRGWVVLEAETDQAIAICDSGKVIDVLFTDVHLNDSTSGWEVAEKLSSRAQWRARRV